MADQPRPKTTIDIPLHSIRRYVPGSGPPPPPISLAPPRDSTAYIIDQFVLPAPKDMTADARRLLYYHIGFTDLPAVKILVPCHKALEYVSPREIEDWEYNNLEKKEEERARLLAEKQRAGPKRKTGRPPKVPMEDVGMSALSPQDQALLLAEEVAGPSLSTPQKRRLHHVLDEEMGDTSNMDSDDAAIQRQLQGEPDSEEDMEFEDELEVDSESVDQLAIHDATSGAETPSRGPSLVAPLPMSSGTSSVATPTRAGSLNPAPAASIYAPSNGSTPGRVHPAWSQAFGRQSQPGLPSKPQVQNGHVHQKETAWSLSTKKAQLKSATATPTTAPALKAGSRSGDSSRISTPDIPAYSAFPANSSASKRKGQPNGKGTPQEKQPKPKKPKIEPEPEPPAEEWEVKDLLDDQWFIEHGVKVHKYLVLWEGDWPEDQNPTWEPAENVQDQALLRRYEKKKKAGLLKPPKKQKTLNQYLAAAKYSSVAEAFEAGIDELAAPAATGGDNDDDAPDETFLVTENVGDITANGRGPALTQASVPPPSFGSFDSMLARYNQTFPRG